LSVWHFEQRDPAGVQIIPKDEEYFAAVSGIVTSLAREMTQNSGDAWDGTLPVQVHFRFGKLDAARFADYVTDLSPHLTHFQIQRETLASTKTVRYLAIEDFGTHGLRGGYGLDEGVESSYVAFWRRYGESSKGEDAGGRHGLGKSTISSASKLRLFFGATIRSDDPQRHLLLQGQISLRPHRVDDKIFDAYGLWYDDSHRTFTPFIDKAAARFAHDFDLRRGKEPGLSVVIPFPDDDLTPEAIIKAVIENTFHQIISGHLIVHMDDTIIDSNTIFRLAEKTGLEKLKSAMTLSAEVRRKTFPSFSPRPETATQRLKVEHFSDAMVAELRKRWAAGDIVSVELPVRIAKKKQARSEMGAVQLYVRREQNSDLRKETYVRGRVTVRLRPTANRTNCVALLVADTGIASAFLGDAEPPAHDHWYINRVRADYQNPRLPLQRILYSVRDLLDLLEEGDTDQPIKDAFVEYLWTVRRQEEEEPEPRPKPPPAPLPPAIPAPPATVTPHRLRRIDGGFAYSYQPENPEADDADGARIVASYRRRTGKKAPKSVKFRDFTDELPVDETGSADLDQVPEPRRVLFKLANISPGYELRVTGFDTNRDLELRLETVTG
jgi:hypothetical protein